MNEWITVKDAAKIRKCTEANIRYLITAGKLEATKDSGRWLIKAETLETEKAFSQPFDVIYLLKAQIEEKAQQLTEKDKQIEKLQEQLAEASHRHDTVVMQMTRLLEYHQQPFWRKLFSRKALPPPEQIMDMEPEDDKSKE